MQALNLLAGRVPPTHSAETIMRAQLIRRGQQLTEEGRIADQFASMLMTFGSRGSVSLELARERWQALLRERIGATPPAGADRERQLAELALHTMTVVLAREVAARSLNAPAGDRAPA